MSRRVAVITTGGTIGSVFSETAIVADALNERLRKEIENIRTLNSLSIEVSPALEKMSENMAPTDWLVIIETISHLIESGHDSIVVTHGTDTMAYTAAALALYFNDKKNIRVCLTGAFYPLDHPDTDARANLEAALAVVTSDKTPSGVYVSFRNSNNAVGIYHGLEISPIHFDSSAFGSMYDKCASIYKGGKIQEFRARNLDFTAGCSVPNYAQLKTVGRNIYQLVSYPGLDLSVFHAQDGDRLLIVDGYHSGTASSERFAGTIIDFKTNNKNSQIALCCVPSKYLTLPYESTLALMDAGINVYTDISPLPLYVLSCCRFAAGVEFSRLLDPVSASRLVQKVASLGAAL